MARTTVVYLGGFGRSGSTLVERMLGSAPGWVNIGELVDLARSVAPGDELCGCGLRFSECAMWTEVGEIAFGGWSREVLDRLVTLHHAAARQRNLPGMLVSARRPTVALAALRAAYARIYAAVAEVTGARVVVDASKGPALGQALAGAPELDVRILNVVRDPRAVAWSWHRQVERPQAGGADLMWQIAPSRSAAQWSALQLEMTTIARLGGAPSARLRYEDFVGDPVGTLVDATAELGLPLDRSELPAVVEGRVELGSSHGLSGNPSRFQVGALALRRDDRWMAEMDTTSRTVVTTLTLPLLTAYGYPVRLSTAPDIGSRTRSYA